MSQAAWRKIQLQHQGKSFYRISTVFGLNKAHTTMTYMQMCTKSHTHHSEKPKQAPPYPLEFSKSITKQQVESHLLYKVHTRAGVSEIYKLADNSSECCIVINQTSSTALMHPSFSGLLVTCAYFPHTTLPPGVTSPSSLTLTSITVPFVITPRDVYD